MLKSIRYFPSKEVRMIANAGGSMRVGMHSLRSDPRCSGRSRNAGCKCQGNQKHFERQLVQEITRCESFIELKRLISEICYHIEKTPYFATINHSVLTSKP